MTADLEETDEVSPSIRRVQRVLPLVKLVWPGSLTLGVTVPVRSMVVPSTRMVLPARLPLMRCVGYEGSWDRAVLSEEVAVALIGCVAR